MARQIPLETLDPRDFLKIGPTRAGMISAAPATKLPLSFPANDLAAALHPEAQFLKIISVEEHGGMAKSFTLAPDSARGTKRLAHFNPGQYICVKLEIGSSRLWKPYSIRSSQKQAAQGTYIITVKKNDDAFASDFILESWKAGDAIETAGPFGELFYEPLRDSATILGIAGGSGITPFYSMARSIAEGTEDFELTLLYGSRSYGEILLREELELIAATCDRVKIIHVLSDEPAPGCESGLITAELIKKCMPDLGGSVFMCGPQAMYAFAEDELKKLGITRVRREAFGQLGNPAGLPGYPGDMPGKIFTLTIRLFESEKTIPARSDESLLTAMERAGILAPSRCRSGECGFCRSRLLSGEVFIPEETDGRRLSDAKYGFIHPCCTYPLSDIALEVPAE